MEPSRGETISFILKLSGVFVLYFTTASVGLSLYAVNEFAALIWPPAGIAIAATYLWGMRMLPAVALGALTANLMNGAPLPTALFIMIGNTLEAAVAAYFMRDHLPLRTAFRTLQGNVDYVVFVGIGSTFLSALVGVSAIALFGMLPIDEYLRTLVTWWVGDALSALTLAPFLISWIRAGTTRFRDVYWIAELSWFAVALMLVNILVFWTPVSALIDYPLFYLILFPLMWAILRLGARGATFAILATTSMASIATLLGSGPFSSTAIPEALFYLQLFVGAISIVFLVFLGIVEEYRSTALTLSESVQELERAITRIRSADQAKDDFLAILSHELRNPLAPVMSSLELMRLEGAQTRNLATVVESAYENVTAMSRILDDLLDITRISQHTFALRRETLPLQPLLDRAIAIAASNIKGRNHELTLSCPTDSVWLDVDPVRFEQIMVNLLNNAAKYTDPGGSIRVSCLMDDTQVHISVSDTGIGIAPHMQEKIFDPFERVDRGRGAGLGIGLSLTRKLVELHGGSITVESAGVGKGSTFTVRLPHPDMAALPIPLPAGAPPEKKAKRFANATPSDTSILIVDDNIAAAEGMSRVLTHLGYATHVAHSGSEALLKFEEYRPDVALVDIGLPDMSGHEIARTVRQKRGSAVFLIAVTGYGHDSDKEEARSAGFDEHLTKPVSVADLEKALSGIHPPYMNGRILAS